MSSTPAIPTKKTALVTGANKGLGKEVVRRLAEDGYQVYLGFREASRGTAAVAEFKGLDVHPLLIDVSSEESVKAAVVELSKQVSALDVLVNNAAVILESLTVPASELSVDTIKATYETNLYGPIRTIQAFLPLLKAAKNNATRIVNVSSGLASLTLHNDATSFVSTVNVLAYDSSKTALNAATVHFAREFKPLGIKVNSADPGYCSTDINGNSGPRTIQQGADIIVKLAELSIDGPTGSFFNDDGVVPW
jgi:NAD(P)-dependent dehydrogenase (short-subunit alcohol dehydrogenase family)